MGKAYVVFVGGKPGVYDTWTKTHAEVNKFSGAIHKSFSSEEEALRAFEAYIEKQSPSASFKASKKARVQPLAQAHKENLRRLKK